MRTPATRILAFLALIAASGSLRAAESKATTTELLREQVLRMTEFFDTMLPGVMDEKNATVSFSPKFSDIRDEEYVRFPLEARYGVYPKWEILGGLVPFIPNPINPGREHRWGMGESKLGVRHDLGPRLGFDESTAGFELRIPLGKPPIDLNDHYSHAKPYLALSRAIRRLPKTTFYANLAYDRSVELTHRGEPPAAVVRRNVIEVAPGLLYRPTELGYFTEYRCHHIATETENHLRHEGYLGMIWDVPLARTRNWRLPGKWQLEIAAKVIHEEGLGNDHGVTARVTWRTTLREVLGAPPRKK